MVWAEVKEISKDIIFVVFDMSIFNDFLKKLAKEKIKMNSILSE